MDDQITKIRTREDHLIGTRFVYLLVVCFKFLLLGGSSISLLLGFLISAYLI